MSLSIDLLLFQILVKAVHVRGVNNVNSDLISRLENKKFLQLNPAAQKTLIPLPLSLWPP